MSVTNPRANGNSCVHAGVVVGQTRIVPGRILPNSAGERMTHASAVTRPGLTAAPLSSFAATGIVRGLPLSCPHRRCGNVRRRHEGPSRRAQRTPRSDPFVQARHTRAMRPLLPEAAIRQRVDRDDGADGSRQFVGAEIEHVVGLGQRACLREPSPKLAGEGTQDRPRAAHVEHGFLAVRIEPSRYPQSPEEPHLGAAAESFEGAADVAPPLGRALALVGIGVVVRAQHQGKQAAHHVRGVFTVRRFREVEV